MCVCVFVCTQRCHTARAHLILACAFEKRISQLGIVLKLLREREEGGMTSAGRKKGRGGLARSTLKAILCPSFMSVFWTPSTEEEQIHQLLQSTIFNFIHTSSLHLILLNIFSISNRHHVCKDPGPHRALLKPSQELSRRKTVWNVKTKSSNKIFIFFPSKIEIKMNFKLDPTGLYWEPTEVSQLSNLQTKTFFKQKLRSRCFQATRPSTLQVFTDPIQHFTA